MEPEAAYDSFSNPFLSHLVHILSIYEIGPPRSPIPCYDGPSTKQTDRILRSLSLITDRMYAAEDTLASMNASRNWENNLDAKDRHALGDLLQPSIPSADSSQGSLSPSAIPFPPFNVTTSPQIPSSSSTPLVIPPSLLNNTAFETNKSAEDELRLVKAQVSDIVRVCDAVARGDLSHKITVPVQGAFMVQVKDVVNRMVDKLVQFAKEVHHVSQVFDTQCIYGGHACTEDLLGIWADLTVNLNKMASNLTNQIRSISEVTQAVAMGDLSRRVQVEAQGEMLELKVTVNTMVIQLSTLADEITRVSLQVGTEGILGGRATVPHAHGIWKVLTDNVNLMVMNTTNQVRSIAEVAKAVTSGDLTKVIEIDLHGELLDLNKTMNGMTESLSDIANEVTRVIREVGMEGLLGRRANVANVSGAWKDLTDYVNMMAVNLTSQVRTIALATTAVARGDLKQKVVGLSVFGEYLNLVNTVNDMIDGLGFFASEVMDVTLGVSAQGNLGLLAKVGSTQGIWREITMSVNALAINLTDQVRAFVQISSAPTKYEFYLREKITNAFTRGAAQLVNRRKSESLCYVAHEIKAPMHDIIAMCEMALDGELNRSQRENWLCVQGLTRSLLSITGDLLDVSKLESGRMVMENVSFSFRQTVFGTLKTLVVRAAGNNVDLTYDVDPDIPDQLIGDFLRLQQVIKKLVANAIEFTCGPKKGHVSLSCRPLAFDNSTVTLEVCVSDDGVGIAKDKLNSISAAFAQADCSTIREYGGVGLGLSISKYLVSLMGGSMWAESVAGKGSKFFFTITSQIGQVSMDATLAKTMPFGNRTILFVDTQYDRTGLVDQIQGLGLKAHVVHDSLEIEDKACPHIDIILVDSLSVAEMIRKYEHLQQIPIVLLAPDLPPLNLKWCYDYGVHSGVTTPLSTQDLASVLVPAIESNTVGPAAPMNHVKFDVLYAEYNFVNQKLGDKTLKKYGHTVEIVENGSLAVEAFKARALQDRPFDIILMNVPLPVMDGLEATESIRAYETQNNLTPTPIIAVTANTATGDKQRFLDAGMDDHIMKPLRRSHLLKLISKFAGERARQGEHTPVDVP